MGDFSFHFTVGVRIRVWLIPTSKWEGNRPNLWWCYKHAPISHGKGTSLDAWEQLTRWGKRLKHECHQVWCNVWVVISPHKKCKKVKRNKIFSLKKYKHKSFQFQVYTDVHHGIIYSSWNLGNSSRLWQGNGIYACHQFDGWTRQIWW